MLFRLDTLPAAYSIKEAKQTYIYWCSQILAVCTIITLKKFNNTNAVCKTDGPICIYKSNATSDSDKEVGTVFNSARNLRGVNICTHKLQSNFTCFAPHVFWWNIIYVLLCWYTRCIFSPDRLPHLNITITIPLLILETLPLTNPYDNILHN